MKAKLSNYINFVRDIIAHPWPNLNGGLTSLPWNLGYEWVGTSYPFIIQIKICAEYRDMLVTQAKAGLLGTWFVRNQVYLTNPAEAWVALPGILHRP